MNTFGTKYRLTTCGESHAASLGGIIDGCPPGLEIDTSFIRQEMARRSSISPYSTPRKEADEVVFLSGIYEGKTLGTPIGFTIANQNQHSEDYKETENLYRPGHGDYTWQQKYGIRDPRGGGRSSARETACRVVAGAIAKLWLRQQGIGIKAEIDSILGKREYDSILAEIAERHDSAGGVVKCRITGVKPGVGEPIFDKLQSRMAAAMFSIPSVTGFETGVGFHAAEMPGSEYADQWNTDFTTRTNHCGGIQGGISNGMPIEMRIAFHPIVTIGKALTYISQNGGLKTRELPGRHDICQVLRVPVIVESMAAITLMDLML